MPRVFHESYPVFDEYLLKPLPENFTDVSGQGPARSPNTQGLAVAAGGAPVVVVFAFDNRPSLTIFVGRVEGVQMPGRPGNFLLDFQLMHTIDAERVAAENTAPSIARRDDYSMLSKRRSVAVSMDGTRIGRCHYQDRGGSATALTVWDTAEAGATPAVTTRSFTWERHLIHSCAFIVDRDMASPEKGITGAVPYVCVAAREYAARGPNRWAAWSSKLRVLAKSGEVIFETTSEIVIENVSMLMDTEQHPIALLQLPDEHAVLVVKRFSPSKHADRIYRVAKIQFNGAAGVDVTATVKDWFDVPTIGDATCEVVATMRGVRDEMIAYSSDFHPLRLAGWGRPNPIRCFSLVPRDSIGTSVLQTLLSEATDGWGKNVANISLETPAEDVKQSSVVSKDIKARIFPTVVQTKTRRDGVPVRAVVVAFLDADTQRIKLATLADAYPRRKYAT